MGAIEKLPFLQKFCIASALFAFVLHVSACIISLQLFPSLLSPQKKGWNEKTFSSSRHWLHLGCICWIFHHPFAKEVISLRFPYAFPIWLSHESWDGTNFLKLTSDWGRSVCGGWTKAPVGMVETQVLPDFLQHREVGFFCECPNSGFSSMKVDFQWSLLCKHLYNKKNILKPS